MKRTDPSLETAQRRFFRRVLGLEPALEFLENEGRMAVYSDGYVARLTGSLRETFALTERALGQDRFFKRARRYVAGNPSRTHDLNAYGEFFPEFLAAGDDGRARPWLAALADLEWRISRSFHAFDVPPLDPAALSRIPPGDLGEAVLTFQDSMQAFASDWPVRAIFDAFQTKASKKDFRPERTHVLMYRQDGVVRFTTIPEQEFLFLESLRYGLPLSDALERAAIDEPAVVFECFRAWPAMGILASAEVRPA